MIDIAPFTDDQWWRMCDLNMSLPVPLRNADLLRPFVYDRAYGVFYCPGGFHQGAMALLYAFSHGGTNFMDVMYSQDMVAEQARAAELWMNEAEGRAFKSSVGRGVHTGRPGSLNAMERRWFNCTIVYSDGLTNEDSEWER